MKIDELTIGQLKEQDIDAIIQEHREMCLLLMQCADEMRITQQKFRLSDKHPLVSKCREVEQYYDSHQSGGEE